MANIGRKVGNNSQSISRHDFLKLMAAAGTVMTFAPFVDWCKFLPNVEASNQSKKQKVELPDGTIANVTRFSHILDKSFLFYRNISVYDFLIACS